MKNFTTEKSLLSALAHDVQSTQLQGVTLFAGHFPLRYFEDAAVAREDFSVWGDFTLYTLELGCKVGELAANAGKDVRFVFLVDDHTYAPSSGRSWARGARRRLYCARSGARAKLPCELEELLGTFGFDKHHILRQDQGRAGRKDCLYFSEYLLRRNGQHREFSSACAREYTEFLEKHHDPTRYLVSFIPDACQGNICNQVLDLGVRGISASHVFFRSDLAVGIVRGEQLWSLYGGVRYRRD